MDSLLEKDTGELMQILAKTGSAETDAFLKSHFPSGQPSFVGYMDALLAQKRLKRQDVIVRANLPQKYGYKLLSGEAHTTNRDKILCLCFAARLSLRETQRALKLYGMNELYPKIPRDVILIVALGQRQYDLDRVNEELTSRGFPPLYRDNEE